MEGFPINYQIKSDSKFYWNSICSSKTYKLNLNTEPLPKGSGFFYDCPSKTLLIINLIMRMITAMIEPTIMNSIFFVFCLTLITCDGLSNCHLI